MKRPAGIPVLFFAATAALCWVVGPSPARSAPRLLQEHTGSCGCTVTIHECALGKGPPAVSECCAAFRDPVSTTVDKLFVKYSISTSPSSCKHGDVVISFYRVLEGGGTALSRVLTTTDGDHVEWDLKDKDGAFAPLGQYLVVVSSSTTGPDGSTSTCTDSMFVDLRNCQEKVNDLAKKAAAEGKGTTRGVYLDLLARVAGNCICAKLQSQLETPPSPYGPLEDPCGIFCITSTMIPKIHEQLNDPNSCMNKAIKAGEEMDRPGRYLDGLSTASPQNGGWNAAGSRSALALMGTGFSAGRLAALQDIAKCEDQIRGDAMKACGKKTFGANDKKVLGDCITQEVQKTLNGLGEFFAKLFGPSAETFLENSERIAAGGSP